MKLTENMALLLTQRWGGIFQKWGGRWHIGPLKQKSQGAQPPPPGSPGSDAYGWSWSWSTHAVALHRARLVLAGMGDCLRVGR